ncbi:glycosyl hydrolase [Aestuariibacter sp. A3R04]|uniref:glycosyl hydrolase n=1 Tax=Aestuariibacter sp. A3R04 TaxID=2841571 RepID=UPI001C0A4394|nr:glycosyl hydrolase [Aestuariibacter sp. A3R04]MBU3023811.1 mannan endo-1,4-beta-mannosidase [Aestuariibacter sp. A3R04]
MNRNRMLFARSMLGASILLGLGGCLGGDDLNTETAVYQPEEKPLNIIAPDNMEIKPGDAVTLEAKLVGTTSGEVIMWEQVSGAEVALNTNTGSTVSFAVPDSVVSDKLVFDIAIVNSQGEVVTDDDGNPLKDTVEITVFDPDSVINADVSDADTILNGVALVVPGDEKFILGANNDAHTGDIEPGMSAVFPINTTPGFYTLNVRYAIPSDYGGKVANVNVNGVDYALEFNATGQWEEMRVGVVEIVEGENTIEVGGGWNYYRIDGISLIPSAEPPAPLPVAPELVNPNATQEAVDLMAFLSENYLTSTLSGQTEFPQKEDNTFPLFETQKIEAATGDDSPAIIAFDYMNYSSSYDGADFDGLTEAIIAHKASRNFIVSALFHWRAPSGNTGTGNGSFYTDGTTFDIAAALADTSSAEYAELLADIDIVAAELKTLQDAGIPVLWRPLHEAQGGWFWWGAKGAEAFKGLWTLMYDRLTNHHGLNNLIWVFTHTDGLGEDWYPGDEMVDIVGFDGYGDPRNDDTHTFASQFKTLQDRHNGKKMVALTETGTIPDVQLMHEQGAMWSFFITWNSEFWNPDSVIGPQGAAPAEVDANYAFDGVLNVDDVPGGRAKVSGVYADFELSVSSWEAQLNWSPTDGIAISDAWAQNGAYALSVTKDMTQPDTLDNVVFQTYPAGGIDVSETDELTIAVNTLEAGANIVAHIFFKAPDGVESWPDAVAVAEGGTTLSIDVSEIDVINGLGVRFMGLDGTATQATYLIDSIALDGEVYQDFEPNTMGWGSQVNWSGVTGTTLSREWASEGMQSLALYQDLSQLDSAENIVLQTYPTGGIDVTGINSLTIDVNAMGAGSSVDGHIFFKAPDGVESWPAATALEEGGSTLSIDVSEVDTLNGLGVRFNNADATSTDARFFVDAIKLDGEHYQGFEGTNGFELQVNWSPAMGLALADDWADSGNFALQGQVTLADGDEVVIQTYPENGILLGDDVSTLNMVVYVPNAAQDTTAKLWAKDKDGNWRDAGAAALTDGMASLSLDISDISELQGFGVQFQGLTSAHTTFYVDTISLD